MAVTERDIPYRGFLVEREKTVSGFNNNCGLNCVLGYILDRARENPDDPIFQEKPYQDLLKHLNDSLKLTGDEKLQDYHDVKFLFDKFQNYRDIEKIFASAMRESLADAWDFYYKKDAKFAKQGITLNINTIVSALGSEYLWEELKGSFGEEIGDIVYGNIELLRAYKINKTVIEESSLLEKALRIGQGGYSLEDYKKELIKIISDALPDKSDAAIEAARITNIDYDELLFKASKETNREAESWIIYLKKKYGVGEDGKLILTQGAVDDVRFYLHKIIVNNISINYKREELFELLGANKNGNKIKFEADDIDDIEFLGEKIQSAILPPDINVSDHWQKPEQEIVSALEEKKRSLDANIEHLLLLSEYSGMMKFAGDYVSGNKTGHINLYKLAIDYNRDKSDVSLRKLKEEIKKHKQFLQEVGYTEEISELEEKLLNPSQKDLLEFKDTLAKYDKYKELEVKVLELMVPGWLSRAKSSSTMVSVDGVMALSSYLGINLEAYSSPKKKLNLAEYLDGVEKIEYQKSEDTRGKPMVRLQEGRGILIDSEKKEIRFIFKDRAYYNQSNLKPGSAISLGGFSCPVTNVTEKDGKVIVSFDYSSLGLVDVGKVNEIICKERAVTIISLAKEVNKLPLNLKKQAREQPLKVFNPHNIHWQRELAKDDVSLYRERDRAHDRIFVRSSFKKSRESATREEDFYTEEEYGIISRSEFIARKEAEIRGEKFVSKLHYPTTEELLAAAADSAAKNWRTLVPELRDARRARLGSTMQPLPYAEREPALEQLRKREAELRKGDGARSNKRGSIAQSRHRARDHRPATDKPVRQEPVKKRKLDGHSSSMPADKKMKGARSGEGLPMTYARDSRDIRVSNVHADETTKDDISGGQEIVVHDVIDLEFKKAFDAFSKEINNAEHNIDMDANKLTETHPKYSQFYTESGSIKAGSDIDILNMEIAKTKAFVGKEVKEEHDDFGKISSYSVTDKKSGENIVNAAMEKGNLIIRATNRDEDTIHLMLAPVVKLMNAAGKKHVKIDVQDHNDPEYALKMFEAAIKQKLYPRIKDQATLDAISAVPELQEKLEKLKTQLPEKPNRRKGLSV